MLNIADFPKHESYKASGVDWLEEIPCSWEEKKLKFICTVNGGGSYGSNPEVRAINYPVATTAQITSDGEFVVDKMPIRGFSSEEVFKFLCKEGDILVVKSSGSISNVISGKAGIVGDDTPPFVFSNFLLSLRVNRDAAVPKYIYYLTASYLTKERVKRMVSGSTYPNLQVQEYISARMPVAPYSEQLIISVFLDKKNAQIDEAIAIKEQQIALLKERKQIIIQKAVTEGLDPNVPMKDSGVDWIGEIPAHWELVPNKAIFSIKKDLVGKRSSDYQLLSLTLRGIVKRDMENPEGKFPAEFDTYQEVKAGDFVFCLFDVEETPRTIGLSDLQGMITGAYTVFSVGSAVERRFLYYFYLNLDSRKMLRPLYKGLRNTIPKDAFLSFKTPLPPLAEQVKIVRFVEDEIDRIEAGVSHMEGQITRLKEYKTTLINSAVTGKIKITPDMVEA